MRSYEKPLVIANEELAEGIYMASGSGVLNLKCSDCDWFVFDQQVNVQPGDNVKGTRKQNQQAGRVINYDHCKADYPNASLVIVSLTDPSRDGEIVVTGTGTETPKVIAKGNDQLGQFKCH